jgi:hypothetical protein
LKWIAPDERKNHVQLNAVMAEGILTVFLDQRSGDKRFDVGCPNEALIAFDDFAHLVVALHLSSALSTIGGSTSNVAGHAVRAGEECPHCESQSTMRA